jgi:hypothetical protein
MFLLFLAVLFKKQACSVSKGAKQESQKQQKDTCGVNKWTKQDRQKHK